MGTERIKETVGHSMRSHSSDQSTFVIPVLMVMDVAICASALRCGTLPVSICYHPIIIPNVDRVDLRAQARIDFHDMHRTQQVAPKPSKTGDMVVNTVLRSELVA